MPASILLVKLLHLRREIFVIGIRKGQRALVHRVERAVYIVFPMAIDEDEVAGDFCAFPVDVGVVGGDGGIRVIGIRRGDRAEGMRKISGGAWPPLHGDGGVELRACCLELRKIVGDGFIFIGDSRSCGNAAVLPPAATTAVCEQNQSQWRSVIGRGGVRVSAAKVACGEKKIAAIARARVIMR